MSSPTEVRPAAGTWQAAVTTYLRRYHRHEVPTQLSTSVLAPIDPSDASDTDTLAQHVQQQMQARMNHLVDARLPVLG